ncbi:galactose-specific lectin nattectin-like [Cyprinodon tularosa]|uniref:galactose-specific lectin nattectin-like n=1 Tax=Cyprinodon tularosa TaxID=77115 RepID=UPI0018E2706A|nr:galactose-specific lectin nattectin-like [Cyprinodon tularosa]
MTSVLLLTLFMCGFGIGATLIQLNNDPQQLGSERENSPQEDPDEGFGGPDGLLRPRTSNAENIEPENPGYDPEVSALSCKCPAGWAFFQGKCYKFFEDKKDWIKAEKHCIELGGNLASIRNSLELAFIRYYIFLEAGTNERTWVGGHDAVEENHWLFSDGTKFEVEDLWGDGEPNDLQGEDCMDINFRGFIVNDEGCERHSAYICKKNLH